MKKLFYGLIALAGLAGLFIFIPASSPDPKEKTADKTHEIKNIEKAFIVNESEKENKEIKPQQDTYEITKKKLQAEINKTISELKLKKTLSIQSLVPKLSDEQIALLLKNTPESLTKDEAYALYKRLSSCSNTPNQSFCLAKKSEIKNTEKLLEIALQKGSPLAQLEVAGDLLTKAYALKRKGDFSKSINTIEKAEKYYKALLPQGVAYSLVNLSGEQADTSNLYLYDPEQAAANLYLFCMLRGCDYQKQISLLQQHDSAIDLNGIKLDSVEVLEKLRTSAEALNSADVIFLLPL